MKQRMFIPKTIPSMRYTNNSSIETLMYVSLAQYHQKIYILFHKSTPNQARTILGMYLSIWVPWPISQLLRGTSYSCRLRTISHGSSSVESVPLPPHRPTTHQYNTGVDPGIFQSRLRRKFWKQNVSWYMFKTYTHKNKTVQKHKGFLIDAEFSISNLGYQPFCLKSPGRIDHKFMDKVKTMDLSCMNI